MKISKRRLCPGQRRLLKHRKGVRSNQRQKFYFGTAKQACKKASLKIGIIIREAQHGLGRNIGYVIDSHDKLLSAALLCSNFSCYAL